MVDVFKLWDIATGKCKETIEIGEPVSCLVFHVESGLVAIIADDLCIRVIDIETQKIVREFWGHSNKITDVVCF